EIAARVGALAVLDELRDGLDACGSRQLAQLGELVVRIHALRQHGEDEPALGLAARRRFRLTRCHGPDYASLSLLRLTTRVTGSRRLPVVGSDSILAARTLELVDVPSESRRESELVALVRSLLAEP